MKFLSEQHKKRISESNKGKKGFWKCKKFSKLHIKNLSEEKIGKILLHQWLV